MIEQKDILADLHIHTIGSVHGFSTLNECILSAAGSGMKYIAITDHYYNDGTEINKINEISRFIHLEEEASQTVSDIRIIGGAEFNIAQEVSDWSKLEKLKWKLIGIHSWFLDRKSTDFNTLLQYYKSASEKYETFSHIERGLHKIGKAHSESSLSDDIADFLKSVVVLSKEKNVILEVNEASLRSRKPGNYDRMCYWLQLAKENGNIISLGSDAHYCEAIGRFKCAIELLNHFDFPKDRILNCNKDMLDCKFCIFPKSAEFQLI